MTTPPDAFAVLRAAGLGGRVLHVPQPSQLEILIGLDEVSQLQQWGYGGQHLYVPQRPVQATGPWARMMTKLQRAGLGGQKIYVPCPPAHAQTSAVRTALQQCAETRTTVYIPAQRTVHMEQLVQTLLDRVETIYERTGSALVTAHPHRPGWAFVQALGATRLARELDVPRTDLVLARTRALHRWRYWIQCYEDPLWQELQAHTTPQRWDAHYHRYLASRATLRRGTGTDTADPLLPFARRSLESRSWTHHTLPRLTPT
jgi:hypothetical protein